MKNLPKRILAIGGAGFAVFSLGSPNVSPNCVRAYHTAITEANQGQTDRALATLNCLLMPRGVTVGPGFSGPKAKTLDRAISVWGSRLSHSPFIYSDSPNPDLKVTFVAKIPKGGDVQGEVHCQRLVYWGERGSQYRVKGTIFIRDNVDGRSLSGAEMSSVIEHELGHVLGLEDDPDPNRLMGPFVAGQPVNGPSADEVQTVLAFRGAVQDVARQLAPRRSVGFSRGAGRRGHRTRRRIHASQIAHETGR